MMDEDDGRVIEEIKNDELTNQAQRMHDKHIKKTYKATKK